MKRAIHNFILMLITVLTFSYTFGYIFVTGVFEKTSTIGAMIWCICTLWIVIFMYVNVKESGRR